MNSQILITPNEDGTVHHLTGESTVVTEIITHRDDHDDCYEVSVKWPNRSEWIYKVVASDWHQILADGIISGSLGRIANGAKREALRSHRV